MGMSGGLVVAAGALREIAAFEKDVSEALR
jgi:hypothetical protein